MGVGMQHSFNNLNLFERSFLTTQLFLRSLGRKLVVFSGCSHALCLARTLVL